MIENKVQEPKTLAETMAEAERRIARQNSAIDLINTIEDTSVSNFTMLIVLIEWKPKIPPSEKFKNCIDVKSIPLL